MNTYAQTVATVSNPYGDKVEVFGPWVRADAPLTRDWQKTYRTVALEIAATEELAITSSGMRVTWRKIAE